MTTMLTTKMKTKMKIVRNICMKTVDENYYENDECKLL